MLVFSSLTIFFDPFITALGFIDRSLVNICLSFTENSLFRNHVDRRIRTEEEPTYETKYADVNSSTSMPKTGTRKRG